MVLWAALSVWLQVASTLVPASVLGLWDATAWMDLVVLVHSLAPLSRSLGSLGLVLMPDSTSLRDSRTTGLGLSSASLTLASGVVSPASLPTLAFLDLVGLRHSWTARLVDWMASRVLGALYRVCLVARGGMLLGASLAV